ncbi:N-acetylmuramoyl-L-alanine amidase [Nocardia sp. 2]|uniref:N-acetylmuramoyl-L-alanine amidase n=1 Tax=Nocardia acididurans TaxID=2802282 RepID=A0ABS1M263_9NOCA|nr:N-acetylmuramoyl-L-alanine amidase [Nocardia acididurans]
MKPSNIKAGIYTAVTAAAFSTVTGLIPVAAQAAPALPDMPQKLQGKTVFLDPGHQGPNHNIDVAKQVSDGRGGSKACQTSGMTSLHGIPEHTINWNVAQLVRTSLEGLGARVVMSRPDDTGWGGCIDDRARAANESGADVALSIHADSADPGQRGYHLIVPQLPIPDAKANEVQSGAGLSASRAMRDAYAQAGFPAAGYNGAVDGIQIRNDVAGPALTQVPDIFLEMGNGANAEDAQQLETPEGQLRHAVTITTGLVSYLLGLSVPPTELDAQAAPGQPAVESEKPATDSGAAAPQTNGGAQPAAPAPQPHAAAPAPAVDPAPAAPQAQQGTEPQAAQPQAAQPQAAQPQAAQPQAAQPQADVKVDAQPQAAAPAPPNAAAPAEVPQPQANPQAAGQPQGGQPAAPQADGQAQAAQPQAAGAPAPQAQQQPAGQPGAPLPQAAQPVLPAQAPAGEPQLGNAVLSFPLLSDIRPVSAPAEPQANPGAAQPNAGAAIPNAGAAQPNAGAQIPNAGAAQPNAAAPQQNPAVSPQANQGPKGHPGSQSPSTADTNPKSENPDLQSMGTLVQLAVKFLNPLAKMLTGQNGIAADLVNLAYSVVSVLMSSAK